MQQMVKKLKDVEMTEMQNRKKYDDMIQILTKKCGNQCISPNINLENTKIKSKYENFCIKKCKSKLNN